MERVIQGSPYSCGVAALQTVTSLDEKTIHSLLGYSPEDINPLDGTPFGMSEIEVIALLFILGYMPSLIVTKEHLMDIAANDASLGRIQRSLCLPDRECLHDVLMGCTAILSTEKQHMLVWDKHYILDSSPDKPGLRNYNEYQISSAIFVQQPIDTIVYH